LLKKPFPYSTGMTQASKGRFFFFSCTRTIRRSGSTALPGGFIPFLFLDVLFVIIIVTVFVAVIFRIVVGANCAGFRTRSTTLASGLLRIAGTTCTGCLSRSAATGRESRSAQKPRHAKPGKKLLQQLRIHTSPPCSEFSLKN